MPIPTRCPACGNTSMIYEQFIGQTIPCQKCGQPLFVTAGPPMAPPQPSSGGSAMSIFVIIGAVLLVGILACGGIAAALFVPAWQSARNRATNLQSLNNLKQLTLAVHTYELTYKTLPPAVVRDPDGKPLYSGLVLLLPFLERRDLFDRFQKDQAWDSPANLPISTQPLPLLLDPGAPAEPPHRTDYQFVTGPGTMFEDGRAVHLGDIRDGLSNTLMLVEVPGTSGSWAKPAGWDVSQNPGPPPSVGPDAAIRVAFGDGAVKALPATVSQQTWRAMTTRSGGEVFRLDP